MIELKYIKQKFNYCKNIPWSDIIDKISHEYSNKTYCEHPIVIKLDKDKEFPPTFILHNDYLPGKLQKVYNIMERKWKIKEMHVYTSLGANSTTFSRHCDSANVLIVQSVGRMNYYVEGLGAIECNPGDGIMIPAGVYHTPYVLESRITLSFSW